MPKIALFFNSVLKILILTKLNSPIILRQILWVKIIEQENIMIDLIGKTAGSIYTALEAKGELTLAKLKTTVKSDAFLTDTALGWLAREDKVNILKSGRSIKVSLK
jgi:hypothetical protein